MDDLIGAALAALLQTLPTIKAVYTEPPESFGDVPAAVILETTGEAARDSYRGGWSSLVTARVVLYAAIRTHLPEAVRVARPWVQPLLVLLAENDVLYAGAVEVAELQTLTWNVGVVQYAKTMYAAVEVTAAYRTDWTVVVGCPPSA